MKSIIIKAITLSIFCLLANAETLAFRTNTTLNVVQDGVLIREIPGVMRDYFVGDGIIAYKVPYNNTLYVAHQNTRFTPVRAAYNINSVEVAGANVFFRSNNSLYVVTSFETEFSYRFISGDIRDFKVFEKPGKVSPISLPGR